MLGRDADAIRYAELAEHVRAAWQAEYVGADGELTPDTQANHVRALAFDLVPAELRSMVADRLVELIRIAGTHLGTGFLATPYLLPVLADTGHLDVAYELLFQDTEPSWLVMIDRGATTMWERWNGVNCRRGAARIAQPLLQGRRGLVPAPVHGRDRTARRRRGSRLPAVPHPAPAGWRADLGAGGPRLAVRAASSRPGRWSTTPSNSGLSCPPGTQAEVVLPDGRTETAGPGVHEFTSIVEPTENPELITK